MVPLTTENTVTLILVAFSSNWSQEMGREVRTVAWHKETHHGRLSNAHNHVTNSCKARHIPFCIFFLQGIFVFLQPTLLFEEKNPLCFQGFIESDCLNCFDKEILFIPSCWELGEVEVNRVETSPSQEQKMKTSQKK